MRITAFKNIPRYSIWILILIVSFFQHTIAGTLDPVTISPGISSVAGKYTDYVIEFTTSVAGGSGTFGLPKKGTIWIDFPPGFQIDYVTVASSSTLDGGLTVEWRDTAELRVVLRRDDTGTDTPANTTVRISFGNVINPTSSGAHSIDVSTTTENGLSEIIDTGTGSVTIGGGLAGFTFSGVNSQIAGQPFSLSVQDAVDEYGLPTNGTIVISNSVNAINSPNGMSPTFNDIIVTDGTGSANQTLVKDTTGVQLQGTCGSVVRETQAFTVTHGSIASIKILEETTGLTPEFGDSTISIGDTADMHAVSYDHYGNYRDNASVDWSETGGIGFVGGIGISTTFEADSSGAGKVVATYGGSLTDETGVITVPDETAIGPLDHILIRTASGGLGRSLSNVDTTITADDVLTLYAAGYDNSNNFIADESVTWSTIGSELKPAISNFTGKVLTFNPTEATDVGGVIMARHAAVGDKFTKTIKVIPGAIHHITIQDGWQQGSNVIDTLTMYAGNEKKMYAIGRDVDDNPVRSVWSKWSAGTVDTNIVVFYPDSSTNTRFYPKKAGFYTVTADSEGITGGQSRITVKPGEAHHLIITTEPIIYPDQTPEVTADTVYVSTDSTLRLYAAAYDAFDNYITNAEPQWAVSGNLDPIPTGGAAYVDFNPSTAGTEGRIHAIPPGFIGDSTGLFIVTPGIVYQLKVALDFQGDTRLLGDTTLVIGDTLLLHAAGYDADGNYSSDSDADWNVFGNIGNTTTSGDSVFFRAARSGQGYIQVSKTGLSSGASGTITIEPGDIHHVVIRDAAIGGGNEVGIRNITADDILQLYAASYDEADNYLGSVVVKWSLEGDLVAVDTSATDTSFKFQPTKAPRSGNIKILHEATNTSDLTGTITIQPGVAFGNIELTADPPGIPADGVSRTYITSDTLHDQHGNQVRQNTLVTVLTTIGTIDTTDLSVDLPGIQVAVNSDGLIVFPLKASSGGGKANVQASSGNASGSVQVAISNVKLISIVADKASVSQGQANIPVRMTVQNLGTEEITIESAGLRFTDSGNVSRNGEYDIVPPGVFPTIHGGQIGSWDMLVTVNLTAALDTIVIDGFITTNIPNVTDYNASNTDGWRVQKPAEIEILKVDALETQVEQGDRDIDVSMKIRNQSGISGATYHITKIKPTFWDGATDVTDDYVSALYGTNPTELAGGDSATINLKVNVNNGARERTSILLNGLVEGYDINSEIVIKDTTADTTDTWAVLKAAQVKISSLKPSHPTVTQGQTSSWYATFVIQNNGYNQVKLDSIDLQFIKVNNITHEYHIEKPGTFLGSGLNVVDRESEDSLRIEITQTGTTKGEVQLRGYVKLSDLIGGGETMEDVAWSHIVVQDPSDVEITNISFSHRDATSNQTLPWQAKVAMKNSGGSDITIDTTRANTNISFSTGTDFIVDYPYFKRTSTTNLGFGEQDTLIFNVAKTGAAPGRSILTFQITCKEKNSASVFQLDAIDSIRVQAEPSITIESVLNDAPNPAGKVNRKQQFPVKVTLKNTGGQNADEVDAIHLRLISNLQPGLLLQKVVHSVSPLATQDVYFDVIAADTFGVDEQYSVYIDSARSDNTNEVVTIDPSGHYKAIATLEDPSKLTVLGYNLPDSVRASDYLPWYIEIVMQDTIGADIVFDKPQAGDVLFMQGDKMVTGYRVTAPDSLKGGGLVLESGQTDRLIYAVKTADNTYGWVKAITSFSPVDQNDPGRTYNINLVDSVFVESAANITIKDAMPFCNYMDGDIGQVNVNQPFRIGAIIRNNGAERADSIHLTLSTKYGSADTAYVKFEDLQILDYVDISSQDTAFFIVTPRKAGRRITFNIELLKAIGHTSKLPVALDQSEQQAYVQIHEPAQLLLSLNTVTGNNVFAIQQDFEVRSSVSKERNTSAVDNSGTFALTVPAGYQIITESGPITTPDTAKFIFNDDLAQKLWTVRAPNSVSGPDSISIEFTHIPLDEYAGQAANVANQISKIPVTIQQTVLSTQSRIIEPTGATDGTVSTSQWFKIFSKISYSENLTNKKVTLILPDLDRDNSYTITGDSPIIDSSYAGIWDCTWKIDAPSKRQDPTYFKIEVSGLEKGDTKKTKVDSILVTTVQRAELELDAYISNPPDLPRDETVVFSTNQDFTITAKVENKGRAQVANEGAYLYLDVSGTNTILEGNARKPFQVGQNVTWKLTAPTTETTFDYIKVRIDSIPVDLNRGVSAEINGEEGDKKKIGIRTVNRGFVTIDTLRISGPTGATDGVVSAGKVFNVEAEVSWHQVDTKLSKPSAEIFLPSAFSTYPKIIYLDAPGIVKWPVTASSLPDTGAEIRMTLKAFDEYHKTYELAVEYEHPLKVKVVKAAAARLYARIAAPESAEDGTVSVGQQFTVEAEIKNDGEAAMRGNYRVSITLPDGYNATVSITQTRDVSQKAIWTITAPYAATSKKDISIELEQLPLDVNTDDYANLSQSSYPVPITTEEKSVQITALKSKVPRALAKGSTNIPLFGLCFQNSGDITSNKLLLKRLQLQLKNRNGELISDPSQAISRIAAVKASEPEIIYCELTAVTNQNPIDLVFSRIDTIVPTIPDSVNIMVDIASDASILDFMFSIDTTSAITIVDMHTNKSPLFKNSSGNPVTGFALNSAYSVIMEADLEKSFCNYPNPFGNSDSPTTKFVYYLKNDADIEIKIFSLIGELVWSKQFTRHESEGLAGMHDEFGTGGPPVYWDARNNDGHIVLNGVYIALFGSSDGEAVTTKIAVIK